MNDHSDIREVIDNWAIWRDQGDWEKFRTLWHPGALMIATWFQGDANQFIEVSQIAWAKGSLVQHVLGGSSVEVRGARAIAQTRMTITARAPVDQVLCDVTCIGRFYDFFEKREDKWGIVLRHPIYEKDRLDPVDPSQKLDLDRKLLNQFPEGYRHLGYMQLKNGLSVAANLPGLRGVEVESLYANGSAWLDGEAITL